MAGGMRVKELGDMNDSNNMDNDRDDSDEEVDHNQVKVQLGVTIHYIIY